MKLKEARIKEVINFFEHRDTDLGFRKLMDCAIDTQDLEIYKKVICLTDWLSENPEQQNAFIERSLSLINQIAKISIEAYPIKNEIINGENLIKSYGHKRFILGPVDITIKKGQVYGLVGENGNGKTTLLRLLAKELRPTSGNLRYNLDNSSDNDYDLRTKLVYIPQRTKKWYGSLKDNLKLVLSQYGVSAEENEIRTLMMIARFGLWDYKELKWHELSSGYKMRFELARTLLRQPELLLLDEPLANLDVLAQQVILEDLKSLANSINNPMALILSSQQLYEVEKVSDKVIFLKNGKYQDNLAVSHTSQAKQLIVEIECLSDRELLKEAFGHLSLDKLIFNGGIYIAYFEGNTKYNEILKALGNHRIDIVYTRNISKSTRRFFVS